MIWKYFSYKEGPHWRVNDLITMDQCRVMLLSLGWKREVFASIQDYDEHGNILAAPLYFDFDGAPDHVIAETRHFVKACEFLVNVTPRIYFSGNKGFHLIIERKIEHVRVHELVALFAKEIGAGLTTLDPKVYRTRAMFRIPGSPASKPGYYKIEIRRRELFDLSFDEIRELATKQRFVQTEHDPSKIDEDVIKQWLTIETPKLPSYTNVAQIDRAAKSVEMEFTPCLRHMLASPAPSGERNMTVYLLAKFFKGCGIDEKSSYEIFSEQPHWAKFEKEGREVSKVIRSVYRSKQEPLLGCKNSGQYAQMMKAYCDPLCHFSDEFPLDSFTNNKSGYGAT